MVVRTRGMILEIKARENAELALGKGEEGQGRVKAYSRVLPR
jgi:hypothetical protein